MRKVLKAPLTALAIFGLSSLSAHATGGDHNCEGRSGKPVTEKEVMVHATVNTVDVEKRSVNMSHQPVKEFDWPAGAIDVNVADNVDLDVLHNGQKIMVALACRDGDIFIITRVMIHGH